MSKKSNWGRILLSGASLAAMGAFTPAFAQDAEEVTDEIVVTATGRAAALQDVPLAVTAVDADTLENTGANDLRDVTQVAPSLTMGTGQSNSSGTIARIRGLGTGSDNPGFEGAVGIFVDGVYRARAGAALADLPDLERVEILRGPQGTLFGRNTSAGAISVVTAGPGFDPGVYLETTFGFDDLEEVGARGGINMPVGDALAFRFDGSVRAREGYITDLISGDDINTTDRGSLRGQMMWDLSPDASLRVIVDGSNTGEVCCGITPLVYGPAQGVISLLTGGLGTPAINTEARGMTVTPGRSYGEDTDEWGISAQLDWDFGGVNFTSITAYRDWEAVRDQDIDFNLIDIAYRDGLEVGFENFTQEFRLQGEAGRINWLVGAFIGDETLDTTDTIRTGATASLYSNVAVLGGTAAAGVCPAVVPGAELYDFTAQESIFQCAVTFLPLIFQPAALAAVNSVNGGYILPFANGNGQQADNWNVETQSWSLFTHNEISFSDQLILTLGLRYNNESKDLSANLLSTGASCTSLQAMETATDASFPTPGGVVSFLVANGFATPMNLACNPAVNTISNGSWTGDHEEEEWSGTGSLAYHLNDDVMIYGGYSRGYKAGGFNVDRSGFTVFPSTTSAASLSTTQLEFDPEFTDAYEIGLRSTLFDGTTTLNLTGFYQQISDYQLNAFNGFNFITRNIPDAITQGVELEVAARPMDNLTINGGVVYTDAYYDSEVRFNPNTACVAGVTPVACTVSPTPNPNDPNAVFEGQPFAFAPEWTVTGGIAYEQPLGGDLRALFYLDARWQSDYRTQTLARDPLGRTDNEGYAILNGRIGIGPENERWSIEFWGRNLTDEFYYVGAFQPPLQDGTFVIYPSVPQTYGVTLRARY
ncbi:MAG: TonB-dependent receptor [Caulobacteraceae bacterium]